MVPALSFAGIQLPSFMIEFKFRNNWNNYGSNNALRGQQALRGALTKVASNEGNKRCEGLRLIFNNAVLTT